ncbi:MULTISPECIES: MFS transporter [unclassified Rhizobium]|uniref:MFS transporter n=1 Tax=Rhizobium TaxID=379 RepID=UPI00084C18E4|nr:MULTISPECIES: MFS transporter [unclassified Rhizobium]OEC96110.1 glucarate transporter [Rhizobium sp. YK2]QYA16321.1 MFS transporter [Rhizobium sp. AB2/73]UEQ84864.1 MFS transporter [Rhizobium sp. AB2/73]
MAISTYYASASRTRYVITALLFITGVINYLDRTNLSITAPSLSAELKIDPVTMGWLFSAFGWTYTAMQIPGGWLADRVHPRIVYPLTILVWSVATFSLGFVAGIVSLFILRLAVGVFEAPSYIVNNRIVTTWFPERERATTIGIYISAQYVGLGFLTPVLVWIEAAHGWRSVFVLTGILGVIAAISWAAIYRDPSKFRGTNDAELDLIREGGGVPELSSRLVREQAGRKSFTWSDLAVVLSKKKLWGLYIGQFSYLASANFFLTWFPTYLVQYRHLDFIKAGFYASVPFLAGFGGVLVSGFISDALLRAGYGLSASRKIPVLTGIALSVLIVGAQFVQSPGLIIMFLAIAFFGTGMASITWSYVSALAPERLIGLTGGVFNLFGGLSSIVIPIAIGYLVNGGSFAPALALCSGLAVVAACCYIFLVGRMERVEE